ncbi:helix-turn-helix domain-containing protein [Ilumatobacter sp.]|uniref:helix-turn-helix domain-containing protein n=1 Tax=Ilumatobacter sp. TaxID=1967498 RepID=UPI003B52DB13
MTTNEHAGDPMAADHHIEPDASGGAARGPSADPPGATDLGSWFDEGDAAASQTPELADDAHDIGARIASARTTIGLSVGDVADRLGVRTSTVEKWEQGGTSPRGHHVSKIAGMLGVSVSWILIGRGVPPTSSDPALAEVRADLADARARLDDLANSLAVLDQKLSAVDRR